MRYPPDFEAFWKAYPKRDGPNPKGEAFGAWKKCLAGGHTEAEMEHGARAYAQAENGKDAQFIVHARRFLRGRWFEDYAEAEIVTYRELTAEEKWAWRTSTGHLLTTPERARVGEECWPPMHVHARAGSRRWSDKA